MKKERTIYYLGLDIRIGSVGWAIISEVNREHWLEDFQDYLTKLEKYNGKRFPASVSFHYMVEKPLKPFWTVRSMANFK